MSSSADLQTLKAVFGDTWSEQELQQVLQESRGDVDLATDRILSGQATRFGEVTTKKKERQTAKKQKDTSELFQPFLNADRGGRGRGRGGASSRGGRGDGRGRGRGRGGATVAATQVGDAKTSKKDSAGTSRQRESAAVDTKSTWEVAAAAPPAEDWSAEPMPNDKSGATAGAPEWDEPATTILEKQVELINTDSWLDTVVGTQSAQTKPKSRIIDKNSKSSWASIAKPPPATPKPVAQKASGTPAETSTVPLTEENLEAATENQPDLPQPPAATVRSMQGEAPTGPSSLVAAPGTPAANVNPPGFKSGGRTGTPLGGRKLNQNQAVVMPGSESQPSKLGLQFGSLNIEDEPDNGPSSNGPPADQQRQQPNEKQYDNFGSGYGNYGMPGQLAGPYPGFGQGHAQYGGMSSFYGGQEPPRQSAFGDYYGHGHQQIPALHGSTSPVQSGHAGAGRDGRYPGSNDASGTSPVASHMSHGQGLAAPLGGAGSPAQHGAHQGYGGYPQQGYPNPYAYYGYGYPQQQPYGAYGQPSMYGQQPPQQGGSQAQAQRGGGAGYGGQTNYLGQQGQGGSSYSVGTSQDRYERSTAEYQRYQGNGSQQGHAASQQGGGQQQQQGGQGQYGHHNDFLGGRSVSQQQASGNGHGSEDAYKGYATTESTPSRDAAKLAQHQGGYPQHQHQQQQQQQQQQYGNHAQYGQPQGQQNQYAQYAQYGGARGAWNQQAY